MCCFFFFQAEDGIRDLTVTGVQTCALPILGNTGVRRVRVRHPASTRLIPNLQLKGVAVQVRVYASRSEEHTSELQSQSNLVCRLLLEKKKKNTCTTLSVNTTIESH